MRKIGIICLIAMLSMLTCFFTRILFESTQGRTSGMFWNSENISRSEKYKVMEESINISGIEDIDLYFNSSDVRIIISDEENLRVVQYSNDDSRKLIIDKGSTRIKLEEEKKFYIFAILPTQVFDIYIPRTYMNNLKVEAASSTIDNSGDITLKKADINLASGDVKLKNTVNIEELKINTASGDIRIEKLESKKLDINTASGDVNIENDLKSEEVKIKTISGEIQINNVHTNKIETNTTSGEIEINEVYGKLIANSVSGEVKVEKTEGSFEGKTTSGDIKLNKFYINDKSKISTVSGDVEVYLNKLSNCRINTKTTSGDINLPSGRNVMGVEPLNEFDLSTTSGDIEIKEY